VDLIYANAEKEDVGVMKNFTFDLAFGDDENSFELTTNTNNHVCAAGFILYMEGTEYGGKVDKVRVATANDEIVYIGRTWHGILASKIIEPDAGEDYLVCSGEANAVIGELLSRLGLSDLFNASAENSTLTIVDYQMNRYVDGYTGIRKMLKSVGAKLKINFQDGFVQLSAEPLVDYSKDDEFDSSQIDFVVEKNYSPTNHLICLGKGELKDRQVIHLYTDADGNISHTQSLTGLDEVTDIYDNANCESLEELEQSGKETLEKAWNTDSLQVDFDSTKVYDVDDIVGSRENTTGIYMAKPIIKKIVTIKDGVVTIQHKVGE